MRIYKIVFLLFFIIFFYYSTRVLFYSSESLSKKDISSTKSLFIDRTTLESQESLKKSLYFTIKEGCRYEIIHQINFEISQKNMSIVFKNLCRGISIKRQFEVYKMILDRIFRDWDLSEFSSIIIVKNNSIKENFELLVRKYFQNLKIELIQTSDMIKDENTIHEFSLNKLIE